MLGSKQLPTHYPGGTPADSFIIFATSLTPRRSSSIRTASSTAAALMVRPRCGQHGEGSTLLWDLAIRTARISSATISSRRNGAQASANALRQDVNQSKAEQLLAGRLYPVQSIATKLSGPTGRSSRAGSIPDGEVLPIFVNPP